MYMSFWFSVKQLYPYGCPFAQQSGIVFRNGEIFFTKAMFVIALHPCMLAPALRAYLHGTIFVPAF